MAQYGRPSADDTTGSWSSTEATLYQALDETSADGSTTNVYETLAADTTDAFRVDLSSMSDPKSSTGHILRVQTKIDSEPGTNQGTWTATLKQSTTTIASFNWTDTDGGAWTTHTYTLSAAEADAITDYSSLKVEITVLTDISNLVSVTCRCTWIEFETPDAVVLPKKVMNGGSWSTILDLQVMNSGSWTAVVGMWVMNSGSWDPLVN